MPLTHLRQSPHWSAYMQTLDWHTHTVNSNQAISRNIPIFNRSVIKIPRPSHPLNPQDLDKLANQIQTLSIIIEPPTHDINNAQLQTHGFRTSKTAYAQSATMYLDLKPPAEQILNSFSENARRQIRRAQKNHLHTETIPMHDFSDPKSPTFDLCLLTFDLFWSLWENLCNMKHFYKLSKPEMHHKMTALAPISYLTFAYPSSQNSPASPDLISDLRSQISDLPCYPTAVAWYVIYDGVIYYLHTGITQQGYDQAANYLLVWEGIKLGKAHNCTIFDFEGLYDARLPQQTKRWRGFSQFKSRFHGQEIYFPLPLVKTYNPIFKAFFHLGELLTRA